MPSISPIVLTFGKHDDKIQVNDDLTPYIIDGGGGSDLLSLNRNSTTVDLVIDISQGGLGADIGDGSRLTSIEQLFFLGGGGNDTIIGGSLGDSMFGGAGNNTMVGGGGDDTINTYGPDHVDGGAGFDFLSVGRTTSAVNLVIDISAGGTGLDIGDGTTILGMEKMQVFSGSGNDSFVGGTAYDVVYGNAGNDTFDGGKGGSGDAFFGGDGRDTVTYTHAGSGVWASFATGSGSAGDAEGDSYSDVENLIGSGFADTLTGGAGRNIIVGGAGDDIIQGMGGADRLSGGSGNDTVSYHYSIGGVNINLLTSAVSGGDAEGDIVSSFENATGGNGDDLIIGTDGDNVLSGGRGNDQLFGMGGNDAIRATDGGDTLDGGSGIDNLILLRRFATSGLTVDISSGGGGTDIGDGTTLDGFERLKFVGGTGDDHVTGSDRHDWLMGGGGADTLTGGGGSDTFAYGPLDAKATAAPDLITDFAVNRDKLSLVAIDAVSGPGDDAFSFIGSAAFSHKAGELRFEQDAAANLTVVQGDTNGDGVADLVITFSGLIDFAAADFLL